jgi:hypothetical protein
LIQRAFGLAVGGVILMSVAAGQGDPPGGRCPFIGGVIRKAVDANAFAVPERVEQVYGRDSLVLAPVGGVIRAIFVVGEGRAVMIRSATWMYTSSGFDSVFVDTGMVVAAGQPIGLARRKMIVLTVCGEKGRVIYDPDRFLDCRVERGRP